MINKLHEHIVHDLQQSARTDTIFVVTAVLFNLIVLAINSAVAGSAVSDKANSSDDFVLVVFFIMGIVVNTISMCALSTGKNTRNKLLKGLLAIYKDNQVDKYYDASLLTHYNKRYVLFTGVIACLMGVSIVVPLMIRFL
ncbi:hypothetical protein JW948_00670 [bacterium]|nr:hypothetical protein [bacterium]